MCTTRRYLFLCSHPATHRFRNELCDAPGVRGCQIRDYNVYLRHPCEKCRNRGTASMYTGEQEPDYEDEWHIPSRCFFDVGFQTLNPFAKESPESASSASSSTRQSIDEDPIAPPHSPVQTKTGEPNICQKLLRRLTLRKPSPCCASQAQKGPHEATRVEGRDDRVDGVILARCESPV